MNRQKIIENKIKDLIESGYKKFIIYPYGDNGRMVKRILNKEFKIHEYMIIDNYLSYKSSDIHHLRDLLKENVHDYIVLVTSENLKIRKELLNRLYDFVTPDNVREIFTGDIINDNEKKEMELVAGNYIFQNIHSGKRCFIIGNGPSLKEERLSLLRDEYVFSVNSFGFVKDYDKVQTNFHLFMDPASVGQGKYASVNNVIRQLENIKNLTKSNPVFFFPTYGAEYVHNNKIDCIANVRYIFIGADVLESPFSYDLSKKINAYINVVMYAISMAFYMGFKDIYLLGVDCTFILYYFKGVLKKETNLHAYNDNEENESYSNNPIPIGDYCYCDYLLYKQYAYLHKQAENLNINIVNCSSTTVLDEFPHMKLEDVIK